MSNYQAQPGRVFTALSWSPAPAGWILDLGSGLLPAASLPDFVENAAKDGKAPGQVARIVAAPPGAVFQPGDQVVYCYGLDLTLYRLPLPGGYKPGADCLIGPVVVDGVVSAGPSALPIAQTVAAAQLLQALYDQGYNDAFSNRPMGSVSDDPRLIVGQAAAAYRCGYEDAQAGRTRRQVPPPVGGVGGGGAGGGPLPVAPNPAAGAYLQGWYEQGYVAGQGRASQPQGPADSTIQAVIAAGYADGAAGVPRRTIPVAGLGDHGGIPPWGHGPAPGYGLMGPPFFIEVYGYGNTGSGVYGMGWEQSGGAVSAGSPVDPYGALLSDLLALLMQRRAAQGTRYAFLGFHPGDQLEGHQLSGPQGPIAQIVAQRFPLAADQQAIQVYGMPVWFGSLDGSPDSPYIRLLSVSELDHTIPGWRNKVRRLLNH